VDELCARSAAELGESYRAGRLSPVEVVEATLARIERLNPLLNAYVSVCRESAIAAARAAEAQFAAGIDVGPLQGVPVSLKDIISVRGCRTTAGSRIFQDAPADEVDADVVRRLRAGGAVVLGKVNLHEFAFGGPDPESAFGTVQNPRRLGHMPGGSSTGSGAAVATGLGVISVGTDTGGSIRQPASLCGLVGLKPTHGLVSAGGVIPVSEQLDDVGPIGRSVADVAAALTVMTGRASKDYVAALRQDVRGLRVGVPVDACFGIGQPAALALQARARGRLQEIGLSLVPVSLRRAYEIRAICNVIAPVDLWKYHARHRGQERLYGKPFREQADAGRRIAAVDYAAALAAKDDVRERWLGIFERIDVLALPGNVATAQRHGTDTVEIGGQAFTPAMLSSPHNRSANLTGFPALALPVGEDDGLPVALQLQAPPWREDRLLAVAHALEQALGHLTRAWGIEVRDAVARVSH
jgi:aspartyl-tRNA(Asn)/glutamyl-tRNA(Gln) amidotransferase subunit A